MKNLSRAIAAGLFHLATLSALTQAAFAADEETFPLSTALSADQLDEMRGGFVTPQGLTISLGIERLFYVNNELVSQIALHIPQLGKALAVLQSGLDVQSQSASAPEAPASVSAPAGGGAPAAPSSAQPASPAAVPALPPAAHTTSVAQTPGAPAVNAPSNAPPAAAVASSAPAASSITSQAPVTVRSPTPTTTVIQSGLQNFVEDKLLAQGVGPGMATVIQNNVDKQILTTMTVVNLRISGIAASVNLAQRLSGLNSGLRLSGR